MFIVTTKNDEKLSLNNYLEGERLPISKVRNIVPLAQKSPHYFLKFISDSIPHTRETIESDLQAYYDDIIKIDDLIASLPLAETPQKKLAFILVELVTGDQVGELVWEQFTEQIWEQFGQQLGEQIWEQFGDQVWDKVEAEVGEQFGRQFEEQVRDQVGELFRDQVGDQAWSQVNEDLRNFQLADSEEQNSRPKPAIDYTCSVFELGSIAMRYSAAFKNILNTTNDLLESHGLGDKQCSNILTNIIGTIPHAPKSNYLIYIKLRLIKRLMPPEI